MATQPTINLADEIASMKPPADPHTDAWTLGFCRARKMAADHVRAALSADLPDNGINPPNMWAALSEIDGEAPADEPRDGPTVGFQPSADPEIDDGNDVVREAFQEGVTRGLWIAANIARVAIAKAEQA